MKVHRKLWLGLAWVASVALVAGLFAGWNATAVSRSLYSIDDVMFKLTDIDLKLGDVNRAVRGLQSSVGASSSSTKVNAIYQAVAGIGNPLDAALVALDDIQSRLAVLTLRSPADTPDQPTGAPVASDAPLGPPAP